MEIENFLDLVISLVVEVVETIHNWPRKRDS